MPILVYTGSSSGKTTYSVLLTLAAAVWTEKPGGVVVHVWSASKAMAVDFVRRLPRRGGGERRGGGVRRGSAAGALPEREHGRGDLGESMTIKNQCRITLAVVAASVAPFIPWGDPNVREAIGVVVLSLACALFLTVLVVGAFGAFDKE